MRVMVLGKATKDSEAGIPPSQELLTAMGKYNEELVKAGILLAGEGLKPSSQGKRVRISGSKRTVIDGPFTEAKELKGTSSGASAFLMSQGRCPGGSSLQLSRVVGPNSSDGVGLRWGRHPC